MTPFRPGLVSVTYRSLDPSRIADLAAKAGLQCIEWGGDIHVPHGDTKKAQNVARITRDHGLDVSSYGSYFRLDSEDDGEHAAVIETALALGAPLIRVWAGKKASAESTPGERLLISRVACNMAAKAATHGLKIAYEYHPNTLTDSIASSAALLSATAHHAICTFWQPPLDADVAQASSSLAAVIPRLANLHVFHWQPAYERRPLAEGRLAWAAYLQVARRSGRRHDLLLEFIPNDDPYLLKQEASSLLEIMGHSQSTREK